MKTIACFIFVLISIFAQAQVRVKGIITEANTNPASGVIKKPLAGVQIKALGATAPDVTDNAGNFILQFEYKKPGEIIKAEITKSGYELFNREALDEWLAANNPNHIHKIKMCLAGQVAQISDESYQSQLKNLKSNMERMKNNLTQLSLTEDSLRKRYKELEEQFLSQQKQLEAYADRFAHIDFDDVSDLYRDAYELFQRGELDSVTRKLEVADLINRADRRIQERNLIDNQQTGLNQRRDDNELGIQQDMQSILLLARTYSMKFEYGKATPLYEKLLLLDSTHVGNLIEVAYYFQARNNFDRSLELNHKVLEMPASAEWQKGDAYRNIGNIYSDIGNYSAALDAFMKFENTYNILLRSEPDSLTYKRGLALSYSNLGDIYQAQGDFTKAIDYFTKEYQLSEELFRKKRCGECIMIGMARTYSNLGNIYQEQGDFIKALEYFQKELKITEELHKDKPMDEVSIQVLTGTYLQLGDIYQAQGDFIKALDYFQKDLTLSEKHYKDNPHSERFKQSLTELYSRLGDISQAQGDFTKALEYFIKYNQLSVEIYRDNPRSLGIKQQLAISYATLGNIYEAQGNFVKALEYYQKDLTVSEELYQNNPRSESSKSGLAGTFRNLGDIYQAQGDFARALECFIKDNQLSEELYRDNPSSENNKHGLAISCSKLGDIYQALGDSTKPLEYFQKYLSLSEELFRVNPLNENIKRDLEFSYARLGYFYQSQADNSDEQADYSKALEYFQKANQLSEELFNHNPHSENIKRDLALSYERLGDVYQAQDIDARAFEYFQKELKLLEELYHGNPRNEDIKNGLATAYNRLGLLSGRPGSQDSTTQREYWEKGVMLLEELYRDNPSNESIKIGLAISYANLTEFWDWTNPAIEYHQKSTLLFEELCRDNPGRIELYQDLANSYQRFAEKYESLEKYREASMYYQKQGAVYLEVAKLFDNEDSVYYYKHEDIKYRSRDYGVYLKIDSLISVIKSSTVNMEKIKYEKEIISLYNQWEDENAQYIGEQSANNYLTAYGNLSRYLLFEKQFAESESSALKAFRIAEQNYVTQNAQWIYTNLASSLLFQGKLEDAKKIYLELKDQAYPQDSTITFRTIFLEDLNLLEKVGVTNPDVSKIRTLLAN